jgi:hypothetical protein
MDKDRKLAALERVVATMLEPMRGVPFDVVVKALSNCTLLPFGENDPHDAELRELLRNAIRDCAVRVGAGENWGLRRGLSA